MIGGLFAETDTDVFDGHIETNFYVNSQGVGVLFHEGAGMGDPYSGTAIYLNSKEQLPQTNLKLIY